MTTSAALRSAPFLILAATNFCCCAAHSGPIFHTVSYAIACGVAPLAAVSIYSLEGLTGMGGRLAFGVLGDRLGAKPVLVAGLLIQAFGALAYMFVGSLDQFYAVAALFGFTYAGVMPLYAVLARENFPARMMGAIIGGTSTAGSLGMALGPLAGGWIYDAYATYAWLYLGSFGIGLGAFLIALTFKPFPGSNRRRRPSRPDRSGSEALPLLLERARFDFEAPRGAVLLGEVGGDRGDASRIDEEVVRAVGETRARHRPADHAVDDDQRDMDARRPEMAGHRIQRARAAPSCSARTPQCLLRRGARRSRRRR